MNASQLLQMVTNLESKASQVTAANPNDEGQWKRIAAAAEKLGNATSIASDTIQGYMLRTAVALEITSGTSGAEETHSYFGYLKRIVDALETKAGGAIPGSLEHRAAQGALNAIFSLYSSYALALAFTDGEYWVSGTRVGEIEGAEQVAGGDGSSVAGWITTGAGSTIAAGGGTINLTSGADQSGAYYSFPTPIGGRYTVSVDVVSAAVSARIVAWTSGLGAVLAFIGPDYSAALGNRTATFVATTATTWLYIQTSPAGAVSIDNVSVKALPGVHQLPGYTYTRSGAKGERNALTTGDVIEDFAANVPGVVPGVGYWSRGAVTNILLQSQDFSSASWFKNPGSTVTANAGIAPDGTASADRAQFTAGAGAGTAISQDTAATSSLVRTCSLWVKSNTGVGQTFGLNMTEPGVAEHRTQHTASADWQRFTRVVTHTLTTSGVRFQLERAIDGTAADLLIWQGGVLPGNFPDGGPIIPTTASAATVGSDALNTTIAAPTDVDQLFFAKANVPSFASSGQTLMTVVDAGVANRILIRTISSLTNVAVTVAGSLIVNDTASLPTAGVDFTIVARRLAGVWRSGLYQNGTLTWFSAGTTAAFPTGMTTVEEGHRAGVDQLDGIIKFAGHKVGTFATDAEVQTILGAA